MTKMTDDEHKAFMAAHEAAMALIDASDEAGNIYDDLDAAWEAVRWPHFIQRQRAYREREAAWEAYQKSLREAGIIHD